MCCLCCVITYFLSTKGEEVMPSIDCLLRFLYKQLEIADEEYRLYLVREITRLEIKKEQMNNATV